MAREKKPVHKVQMTDGKRNIIQQLLQEYDIQSAEDIEYSCAMKSHFRKSGNQMSGKWKSSYASLLA